MRNIHEDGSVWYIRGAPPASTEEEQDTSLFPMRIPLEGPASYDPDAGTHTRFSCKIYQRSHWCSGWFNFTWGKDEAGVAASTPIPTDTARVQAFETLFRVKAAP